MRFVDFKEVQMRKLENGKIAVTEMPRVIVAEHVTGFAPAAIPSGIKGPQDQMVMKAACELCLAGERVLVTCSMEEAMYKIRWESVQVKPPEIEGKSFLATDSLITRTVEKPEEEEESSIIS